MYNWSKQNNHPCIRVLSKNVIWFQRSLVSSGKSNGFDSDVVLDVQSVESFQWVQSMPELQVVLVVDGDHKSIGVDPDDHLEPPTIPKKEKIGYFN